MVTVHTSPVKGKRETLSREEKNSIDDDKLNVNSVDKRKSTMIDSARVSETGMQDAKQDQEGGEEEEKEMNCDVGSDHLQRQGTCHVKKEKEKEDEREAETQGEEEEMQVMSRNKASEREESERYKENTTEEAAAATATAGESEEWSSVDAHRCLKVVCGGPSGDLTREHLFPCTHESLVYTSPSTTDAMDTRTCSNCKYVYTIPSGKVDAAKCIIHKKVRHELDQGM